MLKIIYLVVSHIIIILYVYGSFSFKDTSIIYYRNKSLPILLRFFSTVLFELIFLLFMFWNIQILFPFTFLLIIPLKYLYKKLFKMSFKYMCSFGSIEVPFILIYQIYITTIHPDKLDINSMILNTQSSFVASLFKSFSLLIPYTILEFVISILLITALPLIFIDSNVSMYIKEFKTFILTKDIKRQELSSVLSSYFKILEHNPSKRKYLYLLVIVITAMIPVFMLYEGYSSANNQFWSSLDYFKNIILALLIPVIIKLIYDKKRKTLYNTSCDFLLVFEKYTILASRHFDYYDKQMSVIKNGSQKVDEILKSLNNPNHIDLHQMKSKIENGELSNDDLIKLKADVAQDTEKLKDASKISKNNIEMADELEKRVEEFSNTTDEYLEKLKKLANIIRDLEDQDKINEKTIL